MLVRLHENRQVLSFSSIASQAGHATRQPASNGSGLRNRSSSFPVEAVSRGVKAELFNRSIDGVREPKMARDLSSAL